ncbi:hypothetical protein [Ornithinibacillus sp. JPR2-1]|uniref:hypothetical protein n=1 Tax=Ornithinibacillus sp. JPR2-1 TaxID=2094019 RepID=UPI0031DFB6D2
MIRLILMTIVFLLLYGCSPDIEKEEVMLSSGVQYIGDNESMVQAFEKLPTHVKYSSVIDNSLEEYKLVIIEPHYIKQITKEKLIESIQDGFFIFFINLDDRNWIQEAYFDQLGYTEKKFDKVWTEHIYLHNGQLQSVTLSTNSDIENQLLQWIQYFDRYKEGSL